ncbi:MAG: type II secretion system protein, partial [Planctomycetes bacterium]|nr:type II secretion system protein [Planctomycetota bacterium]
MNRTRERGFALIAVLVALAILLTLAVPFLLGSTLAETSSQERVDRLQTEWAAASVRDLLLARAARGAPGVDLTPLADAVDEFPGQVDLQKPFDALRAEGRHLLGGEVYDLERRLDLNTVGPLALANLLGTTTRVSGLHAADADRLTVERADRLPPQGFVLVDRELIGYGRIEGNVLRDLRRGLLAEAGLEVAHEVHDGSLVLDYRVLLAVQWPFDRPGLERRKRLPYSSVRELARLAELGFGAFTAEELDRLELHCATGAIPEHGTLFGKPERVFNAEIPAGSRVLQVRSAKFLGGGSVVRVRSLDGRSQEYALVWSTEQPDAPLGDVALPNRWHVNLLFPLAQEFPADETVVEPLVPVPVNANTALPEVLTALVANLRPARQVRFQRDGDTVKPTAFQPPLSDAEARTFVDQIVALRG